jgi:hypothetical protein
MAHLLYAARPPRRGDSGSGRSRYQYDTPITGLRKAIRERALRPVCAACKQTSSPDRAVIDHPPGDETQWDWLELPDPPAGWGWGDTAFVLIGALPHSSRWRGWLAECTDQPHLVEGLDAVARRLGGLTRRWRFDRMSTVAQPQSGRLQVSFGPIARHYSVGVDPYARPITPGAKAEWKRPPG